MPSAARPCDAVGRAAVERNPDSGHITSEPHESRVKRLGFKAYHNSMRKLLTYCSVSEVQVGGGFKLAWHYYQYSVPHFPMPMSDAWHVR